MAYKVIILYRLYMPSYFLGTFTEYPFLSPYVTIVSYHTNSFPSREKRLRKEITVYSHFLCFPRRSLTFPQAETYGSAPRDLRFRLGKHKKQAEAYLKTPALIVK